MAALDFPNAPSVGETFPDPPISGSPVWTWDGEKWVSAVGGGGGPTPPVGIAFVMPGKPPAQMRLHVPIVEPLIIPPNLAGSYAYAWRGATTYTNFDLMRIPLVGNMSAVGRIMAPDNQDSVYGTRNFIFAGPGATVAPGDVLLLHNSHYVADATLADVGITIYAERG